MATDAELARKSFEATKRILKEANGLATEGPLGRPFAENQQRIRLAAQRLLDALDGDDLDTIDRTARLLGAEALGVQSATLRMRARPK